MKKVGLTMIESWHLFILEIGNFEKGRTLLGALTLGNLETNNRTHDEREPV